MLKQGICHRRPSPGREPAPLHFRKTCELKKSVVLILDLLTNGLYVSSPGRDSVQYCNIGLLLSVAVRTDGNPLHSQGLIRGLLCGYLQQGCYNLYKQQFCLDLCIHSPLFNWYTRDPDGKRTVKGSNFFIAKQ